MQINILLPYKEKFDRNKASSVSITIKNNLNYSMFSKNIKIYGQNVDQPMFKKNFIGIKYSIFSLMSKNSFLSSKMLNNISKTKDEKHLIELHNRPYLIDKIAKTINSPITLFLHNDPQTMKGSKLVKDRENILEKCAAVFCVSEYIKKQFLYGISYENNKVHVLYNGVERKIKKFPKKKKEILFVGRLVPEKGVDLYVEVIKTIAENYPKWNFGLIGSFRLGENTHTNSFAEMIIKKFKEVGSQAKFYGFKNKTFVDKKMKTASILVVPSLWEEPYGLVVAEAMSNGTCVIASKVGGIPEIIKNNGVLIENINFKNLKIKLEELLTNDKLRETYQKKAWKYFEFSSKKSSKRLDEFRQNIFLNHF